MDGTKSISLALAVILMSGTWIVVRATGQTATPGKASKANAVPPAAINQAPNREQTPAQKRFSALIQRRRSECKSHTPSDNASRLLAKVSSGEVKLDNSSLMSLTRSVLAALDVPLSSQLLVFSGSASQGTNVNPHNPRAIYFNDEVYVGIVPGGLLEMIGVDPKIGGVLYTFRQVGTGRTPTTTGGEECMRCHSRYQSGYAPGFFVRSLVPTEKGSLLGDEGLGEEGHDRPLGRRFGGWFVTSSEPDIFGKAGLIAKTESAISRRAIGYRSTQPGQLYKSDLHLAEGSDILAHLLHEHQIGFHNRLARVLMSASDDGRQDGQQVVTTHAQDIASLVAYMLFRNEAALPEGGVVGDPKFVADFSRNRHASRAGTALKDLDLTTHLLRHRCSYMIHTRPWQEMPSGVKRKVYDELRSALIGDGVLGDHLPTDEKRAIVQILRDTVPDLPHDWQS